MNPFYRAAIAACREAKKFLESTTDERLFFKDGFIGAGGDRSSGLDLALEKILAEHLSPFGEIDSEESGKIGGGEERIILDPLDGSVNALSRFPYFGVSVARLDAQGLLRDALVCNLANGELFLLDEKGTPLRGRTDGDEWTVVPNAPRPEIGLFEKAYAHPEIVAALGREGLKFRAPGAVALSLAYARNARYFLFVGPYRIYDFAAGLALCRDLKVIVDDRFVIVSRDPETAGKIEKIVLENLS